LVGSINIEAWGTSKRVIDVADRKQIRRREFVSTLAGAALIGTTAVSGCVSHTNGERGTAARDVTPAGSREVVWSLDEYEWSLTAEDTFDTIDSSIWSYEVGNGHDEGIPGWGNSELQYYTAGDNARIEESNLVIEAREEERSDEHGDYEYTSTRMTTQHSLTVESGRVEIDAKLPTGQGIWPALWMLGSDIDEVGWPACGEIDITELVGHEPSTVHGSLHGPQYSGGAGLSGSYELSEATFADEFHTFSIAWTTDGISWFIDDNRYYTVTRTEIESTHGEWVFDGHFYLIFNIAIGGVWPGAPDETTEFPKQMEVERLSLYERV